VGYEVVLVRSRYSLIVGLALMTAASSGCAAAVTPAPKTADGMCLDTGAPAAPAKHAAASSTPSTPPPLTSAKDAARAVALLEDGASGSWPTTTPEAVGLHREALERLVVLAEETESESLLVLRGDRVVVARSFGKSPARLELMSVTKGFVGIAIGFLLDEGKIASLDAPLSTWFPEWKGDAKKARVTLRHIVNHTSGLAHKQHARELTKQKDRIAYVRALPMNTEPGETFSYNNEAAQLLSFIIAAAAHEPVDTYLKKKLFAPLGIEDVGWEHDAAGNTATFYGLSMSALDLVKVGVALRDGGKWNGKQVIPASWLDRMKEPAKNASWTGALTWLVYDGPWQVQTAEQRATLVKAGFAAASKLAPLDGTKFTSRAAYWMAAGPLLVPSEREALGELARDDTLPIGNVDGKLIGFDFNGWLGQYLLVYPEAGIVAVRQRREPPNVTDDDNRKIGMQDFPQRVRAAFGGPS
jgi:CubicO group peptidase (beta-lactamase class C family)